jgi:biopolymer transport protein ExbB/TolQ
MLTQKLLAISLFGSEWVVYLLLLLSAFSVTVIIERILYLRLKKGNVKGLAEKLPAGKDAVSEEKMKKILSAEKSSPATVASSVLSHLQDKELDFEECLAMALSEEKLQLENRIIFLGTIGSTAPFLGLFGTVLGIINAFHALSLSNQGGPQVMASISEALVATALGLFVAIPAVTAYNHFVRDIRGIMVTSENFTRAILVSATRQKRRGP